MVVIGRHLDRAAVRGRIVVAVIDIVAPHVRDPVVRVRAAAVVVHELALYLRRRLYLVRELLRQLVLDVGAVLPHQIVELRRDLAVGHKGQKLVLRRRERLLALCRGYVHEGHAPVDLVHRDGAVLHHPRGLVGPDQREHFDVLRLPALRRDRVPVVHHRALIADEVRAHAQVRQGLHQRIARLAGVLLRNGLQRAEALLVNAARAQLLRARAAEVRDKQLDKLLRRAVLPVYPVGRRVGLVLAEQAEDAVRLEVAHGADELEAAQPVRRHGAKLRHAGIVSVAAPLHLLRHLPVVRRRHLADDHVEARVREPAHAHEGAALPQFGLAECLSAAVRLRLGCGRRRAGLGGAAGSAAAVAVLGRA